MCIRDRLYTKDNLPEKSTRTWVTKTVAEKSSDGSIHYVTKLSDAYKAVSYTHLDVYKRQ